MDGWISFALGPLLRFSVAALVLGLLYRVGAALAQAAGTVRRAADREAPVGQLLGTTAQWALPVRAFRTQPLLTVFSVGFHVGLVGLGLFAASHVRLLGLPAWWPRLGAGTGDLLAWIALVGLAGVAAFRAFWNAARALSGFQDVMLLVILVLLVATGYLGAHPELSPFGARTMVLVHALLGNLALLLTPTTKLAHCVTFPFVRVVSFFGWRNPAGVGRRIEVALGKEGDPV